MTEQEFKQLAAEGFNRVPVVLETFADLDTPLSVYLKLANKPYSYLLESVQGGERFGRYSFIGLPAETRFEVRGHLCREMRGNELVAESQQEDPLAWVAEQQARVRAAPRPDLPRFLGGLVGCFGYETVKYIEKRLAGSDKPDSLQTPDILLLLSEQIVAFDNLSGKLYLVVYADPGETGAWQQAQARLQLQREPYALPEMVLNPEVDDLFAFRFDDFELRNYQCHDHIKAAVAV